MKKTSLLLALLLAPLTHAQNVTLEWSLDAVDCAGDPAEYAQMEIFVSEAPILASDISCASNASEVDTRPAGDNIILTAQTPNVGNGSIDVNLLGGRTYYVRARVSNPGGEWSNLSLQAEKTIPAGSLQAPVIIRFGD